MTALPYFPTRRSSDLLKIRTRAFVVLGSDLRMRQRLSPSRTGTMISVTTMLGHNSRARSRADLPRSEEHTSELQSPCNLVCRLLLEKKTRNNSSEHQS